MLQIMKQSKMQRNERDIYVMMEFFCKHEFLKYQEPVHRYYKDLASICSLRIYPAPGEELTPEEELFTEANSPSNKSPLKKAKVEVVNSRVPPDSMQETHITFILSGTLLARERGDRHGITHRYHEGDCICNEALINPKVPLSSAAIDLNIAENVVLKYMLGKGIMTMNTKRPIEYEVDHGSPLVLMQIKNKDYLSITEDYRKARHQRIARFIIDRSVGPVFSKRDPVWYDVFLR